MLFLGIFIFLQHKMLEATLHKCGEKDGDKVLVRKKFSEVYPNRWYTKKVRKEVEHTIVAFSTRKDLTASVALELYKTLLKELPIDSGALRECHRIMYWYAKEAERTQEMIKEYNLFSAFFDLESYDVSSFES